MKNPSNTQKRLHSQGIAERASDQDGGRKTPWLWSEARYNWRRKAACAGLRTERDSPLERWACSRVLPLRLGSLPVRRRSNRILLQIYDRAGYALALVAGEVKRGECHVP